MWTLGERSPNGAIGRMSCTGLHRLPTRGEGVPPEDSIAAFAVCRWLSECEVVHEGRKSRTRTDSANLGPADSTGWRLWPASTPRGVRRTAAADSRLPAKLAATKPVALEADCDARFTPRRGAGRTRVPVLGGLTFHDQVRRGGLLRGGVKGDAPGSRRLFWETVAANRQNLDNRAALPKDQPVGIFRLRLRRTSRGSMLTGGVKFAPRIAMPAPSGRAFPVPPGSDEPPGARHPGPR